MMIMFFPAFVLAIAAAQSTGQPISYVNPDVAAQRLMTCGVKHVAARDDRLLQENVLVVGGITRASEKQFRCAVQVSLSSITYVQFPGPLNDRYEQLYSRMERDKSRRDARAWLQRKGLLAKLPIYSKGNDDLAFARRLEALCGPKARGVFIRDRGTVTMNIGILEKPSMDEQSFVCLTNAGTASGFPMGFVGNEFYAEDKYPSPK